MRGHPSEKIDEFDVADRKCIVRAVQDPATLAWKVRGYVESVPVGELYSVSAENASDAKVQNPDADLVADLMAQAREAIENGTVPLPPKRP